MSKKSGIFRTLIVLIAVGALFCGAFFGSPSQTAYAEGGIGDPILIDTNSVPDNNGTGDEPGSVDQIPWIDIITLLSSMI